MSLASTILALSPSSYWKLHETASPFADEQGAVSGTEFGTLTKNQASIITSDPTGKSVLFPHDGSAITLTNTYDFVGTTSFTVLAFLRPVAFDATNANWIWGNRDAALRGWTLYAASPAVTWTMERGDNAGFDTVTYGGMSEATYENGVTKMVAMRYNGTNLTLNIDGVDVATGASSKSLVAPTTDTVLNFGRYGGGGSSYDGYASNLAIWNGTALTEANLASIYAASLSSTQTLLPDADTVTGGWATAPLFSKINDSSDATVISATAA